MFSRSRNGHLPLTGASHPRSSLDKLGGKIGRQPSQAFPRRYLRALLASALIAGVFWYLSRSSTPERQPPLYEHFHDYEIHLPQHRDDLPFPEGQTRKYIAVSNFQNGVGWGNVLQEMILNAFLAFSAKRSFVFYNYTWNHNNGDYSRYNGKLIPSRVPLSALLSGPLVGGELGPEIKDIPRAISRDYFNQVCTERTLIRGEEVKNHLPNDATASQIVDAWVQKLNEVNSTCIEITRGSAQIFDYLCVLLIPDGYVRKSHIFVRLFGSKNVLDIWPALSQSPLISRFNWSPLIHSAYDGNRHLFEITSPKTRPMSSLLSPIPSPPFAPLSNLLVVHLRRGDYTDHCNHLARWSSEYNGFNRFDELPDKFTVPRGGSWGDNTPENFDIYKSHCLPTIQQIVTKVADVKRRIPGLKRLYIMTNGKNQWLNELSEALQTSTKWDAISTTRDLSLTWEQKFVSQALDMYVGQRAHAFIGNGWSSLTSNIVMLRMAGKHEPNTTFFW
ncbi:hypothetical protein AMATHDRAFT_51022 [Amanita thiersii Skay4041]|uniref:Uncharacterized protein n=1 Tax=Amanita thiersii Skay4041 TaxID=703135 RepID=A0A2A9NFI0_9AGAR|nr:hypothetical protein AMATHDRAFT_51022 [Amanita thiersii Skay4041]